LRIRYLKPVLSRFQNLINFPKMQPRYIIAIYSLTFN
jgi:hypothetical protein